MPIQRPLDFFTRMGPSDVLLAGHVQKVPDDVGPADALLQVTPPQCDAEEVFNNPGDIKYTVTLPGVGSLDIAGVCTSFSPSNPADTFRHIVHSYDRDTRTIEFRILEKAGATPPVEVPLEVFQRVYFWVHLYDSKPQAPNLVEVP